MTNERAVRISRISAFSYRCPNDVPVETSFGIMRDRPAVFVRVEDEDGAFGWGEIFANWPSAGAEHRVNLLHHDIASLVLGMEFTSPDHLLGQLENLTRIRALQCGEEGPFRQVIAGLDIAMWDLFARRAGVPVRKLLSAGSSDTVGAYASGIHHRAAALVIDDARKQGFTAFKVKVGFGKGDDEAAAVGDLLAGLLPGETLAADANQAWDVQGALDFLNPLDDSGLAWIEEPLPAYSAASDWSALARSVSVPVAAGENIAGHADFAAAIEQGTFAVLQPDVIKWGGLTGCLAVAQKALEAGLRFCPHYLGGGIGLAASGEILAAAGGGGLLEVDVNPNPLREDIISSANHVEAGRWKCCDAPGLGIETLPESIEHYRTHAMDITA